MSQIPLPLGFAGSEKLPKTRTDLRNCFNTGEGTIIPRLGISQLNLFDNAARGSFRWQDNLFGVWGEELYIVDDLETGAVTLIGTIEGSEVIVVDVSFNEAVIVVKSSFTYTLDTSNVLVDITTNANMQANIDVAQIDGRFVYIPFDGSPAYFSDIGDAGSIQPLSFFDAEELPDRNNGVWNLSNTLFITGTDSIEKFRDTGETPNPFTRIQGARQNYGLIGGKQEQTDIFYFVGREKDEDFGIYATSANRTTKISNSAIDFLLGQYTLTQLASCISGGMKIRGYNIATFTFADDSFGFYKGNWFTLDTVVDDVSRPWLGGFITEIDTSYYTASGPFLGHFEDINTDFTLRITRTIDLGFDHPDDKRFSCQSVHLGVSQGFNEEDGSVAILMSRDNVLYGPEAYRDLGELGHYADKMVWNPPGGLGNYDGFMGIRIYTTQNIFFAVDKFFVNVR